MIDRSQSNTYELPREVEDCIQRCEGYVALKMPHRAEQELNRIDSCHHHHLLVIRAKIAWLVLRKNWSEALPLIRSLREGVPAEVEFWIHDAYITRRADHILAAETILEEASKRFPEESTIPYNLACYACQLGQLDKARTLLKTALSMSDAWLSIALDDDDLIALRDELEELT